MYQDSCTPTPHCLITLLSILAEQFGYDLKEKKKPEPQADPFAPYSSYSDQEIQTTLDYTLAQLYVYSQKWSQLLVENGIVLGARANYMLDRRPEEMKILSQRVELILAEIRDRKQDHTSRLLYTPFSQWVKSEEAAGLVAKHLQSGGESAT